MDMKVIWWFQTLVKYTEKMFVISKNHTQAFFLDGFQKFRAIVIKL